MSSSTTPLLANGSKRQQQQQEDAKITRIQSQISDTQHIMQQNIHQTIQRGEQFNDLDDKSVFLESESTRFREKSSQVRKNICMQYYKQMAIFAAIVIAVILLIVFLVWINKK